VLTIPLPYFQLVYGRGGGGGVNERKKYVFCSRFMMIFNSSTRANEQTERASEQQQ
jgi:hypothetical protein